MTYAITQTCCSGATCVAVCPVNCIHPTPEERAFGSTEMLHIDPVSCIDCGACADACPVDAIFPVDTLAPAQEEYAAINAAYFEDRDRHPDSGADAVEDSPNFHAWGSPSFPRVLPSDLAPLRIAVVGTGPAGMYAVQDLLLHTNAEVTLIDRLPVAGGLVRYGVAPDHPATKKVGETFARFHTHHRVRMHLGLEVGADVTPQELAEHHDAVVYAVGAAADRRLSVPGEDLTGTISARTFVAWYNAHPDVAHDAIDLRAERVVVVGNGNVALDVARILLADPDALARTDIADHALKALRASSVREVVLLGRRGPDDAAYTTPELLALKHVPGLHLLVDDHDPRIGAAIDAAAGTNDKAAVLKDVPRGPFDADVAPPPGRRIVLRFHSSPGWAARGVGRSGRSPQRRPTPPRSESGPGRTGGAGGHGLLRWSWTSTSWSPATLPTFSTAKAASRVRQRRSTATGQPWRSAVTVPASTVPETSAGECSTRKLPVHAAGRGPSLP
ncbi:MULTISPECIES: FAD-dependent oxidoreductase [unclassified Streptomyces]|uniref:FAD-dependent oxidoreductase n=1 Tax=unclassified Streptomyces TaxID=2593676 RepID=UPI002E26785A|nr:MULTISPECIES: FAD-dependent oxidoreductase [unclassified Streptomyces]